MLHAVLVGIDRYNDPRIRKLRYARADAEALARLFESRIHLAEREVCVFADEAATNVNLMTHIGDHLSRVIKKDDVVVLFFAGHGAPESASPGLDARRYLVMNNTDQDALFGTGSTWRWN